MKKYTENHEWVELDGDVAAVGITGYAAEQMQDLVFVDLPDLDLDCSSGDSVSTLESVKAASEVYSPCDGKVVAVNDALNSDPELVNRDSEGDGWLFKLKVSEVAQLDSLMDQSAYQEFLQK